MDIVRKTAGTVDEYTWRFVPASLKAAIDRSSWLFLFVTYFTVSVLVLLRFVILKRSFFFHSSPLTTNVDSGTQFKELFIHLAFFFLPTLVAFTFNRNRPAPQ
jgi:hypothetical protein